MVFMSSLTALQGGVKHSSGAGQLTGGNATPWLCLGQVYTCAWHSAKQGLSFIVAMSLVKLTVLSLLMIIKLALNFLPMLKA